MKTNNLNTIVFMLGAAVILGAPIQPLWAQQPGGGTPTAPDAGAPVAAGSGGPVALSTSTVAPAAVAPMPTVSSLPAATGVMADGAMDNSPATTDPAVTALLDRLKRDSTPLSISDMSAAQDTLARLSLLLQIEQKLTDVQEAHAKRELAGMGGMSDAPTLSSSQVLNNAASQTANPIRKWKSGASAIKVVTIAGASGRYSAVLDVDGNQVMARPGTVLQDGSKVSAVSAAGVTVRDHGKTKTLPFMQDAIGMN